MKARAVAAVDPYHVSDPNQPPAEPSEEFQIKTDWKTIDIINDYQDGSVESDSKSSSRAPAQHALTETRLLRT